MKYIGEALTSGSATNCLSIRLVFHKLDLIRFVSPHYLLHHVHDGVLHRYLSPQLFSDQYCIKLRQADSTALWNYNRTFVFSSLLLFQSPSNNHVQ